MSMGGQESAGVGGEGMGERQPGGGLATSARWRPTLTPSLSRTV